MRRVAWAAVGGLVLAAGAGWYVAADRDTAAAESTGGGPPATAKVTRGTLTVSENVDGTLHHGEPTTVTGRLPGMVTGLPEEGSRVERGQTLYHVDGGPVLLMYGDRPLHRRLAPGVEGADVRLFETNLAALGYRGFTVDDEYTSSTADAVERWQEKLGLPETGTVELGRVVMAADAVRVGQVRAHLGDNATGPVLDHTGASRLVTVELDVTKQELAKVGDATTVELPDGTVVEGSITEVGKVATTRTGANDSTSVTVDVTVFLADQSKLGPYDEAPVEVRLVSDEREGVLIVPVAALLALSEGGYGVQVVTGGTSAIVAVKTGLFSGGRVEVSGDGIAEGTVVGVPA